MENNQGDAISTVALNTKVEADFVGPLTAVRGALEILRDYPDLGEVERGRFVSTALRSCQQLERAVHDLAVSVYAAGQKGALTVAPGADDVAAQEGYGDRIDIHDELSVMELDFSHLVFSDSEIVNDVYDAVERAIRRSGRKWYFVINFEECHIWPEAWIAYAHRSKKIAVNHALGTVRYSPAGEDSEEHFSTRDEALKHIALMKG